MPVEKVRGGVTPSPADGDLTVLVDNGSTDGSVEWLKEQEIPSIFLPENTGFSGAVNWGSGRQIRRM